VYLATYVSCSCSVLLLRIEARRGICPLPTAHSQFGLLIRGFLQKDLCPMARGATPSPAAASVPVAVADSQTRSAIAPAQLGAFKPETTSPSEAISDLCALPQRHRRQTGSSHALSVARDDDNPQPPSDTLFVRTRLAAGSLSGRLERLPSGFLQPGRIIDAASPESRSSFGGSSSPSRAPLLAFPTRLTCTAIPRSFHDVHDIHDSRYSPSAIH